MTREMLNTLFVMTPAAFVRLDHDTLKVEADHVKVAQVPLHHLGSIVLFGSAMMSSQAMCRCAEEGRSVVLLDFAGRFKARVSGPVCGNVLLRKAQYDAHSSSRRTCDIARSVVAGKIRNSRHTTLRASRDCGDAEKRARLRQCAEALGFLLAMLPAAVDVDAVRGIEGQAAALYFDIFSDFLNVPTEEFSFKLRTRRPPRDRVNALLSFVYSLLTNDCTAACEGVGLDPQFGYLHCLRPGRPSLALDLMEEFRSYLADRMVLTLINRRQIQPHHFEDHPGDGVTLTDVGRKTVLEAYQKRKQEEVPHPLLKENAPLGLLPHLQARLLARHLRGDLAEYIPFLV